MTQGAPATRRDFLTLATAAFGAFGLGAAAVPFLRALGPTKDLVAAGVVDVDIGGMKDGELKVVLWRKQPVFVLRRSLEMIQRDEGIDPRTLQDPALPPERVKKPEWLVCLGICTHLGCLPTLEPLPGLGRPGFYCPCHGGEYDTLGRRLAGPPPENLHLVPYAFADSNRLAVGSPAFAGFGENVRKVQELAKT